MPGGIFAAYWALSQSLLTVPDPETFDALGSYEELREVTAGTVVTIPYESSGFELWDLHTRAAFRILSLPCILAGTRQRT